MNNTSTGRNFCSHCGAKLDVDARFCSNCGAMQEAAPVQETEVLAPPAPAYTPEPTPVAVEAPASGFRFPVAPLIFASIAAFYYLYILFFKSYNSFGTNLLYFTPYVLMVLGLILCKKEKNILFGVAFLMMGGVELIYWLYNTFVHNYYFSRPEFFVDVLIYLPQLIFTALIGIPYLTGRASAKGMKNSFAAWVIVLSFHVMLFTCIRYSAYYRLPTQLYTRLVLSFALLTLPSMIAALAYTPFKKQ